MRTFLLERISSYQQGDKIDMKEKISSSAGEAYSIISNDVSGDRMK